MTSENNIYNDNHVKPTETDTFGEDGQVQVEDEKTTAKLILFVRNITVEPPLFLFIIANLIGSTATVNLSLEKACRVNLNFTDAICDSIRAQELDASNQYEREIQKLVSEVYVWKTYISATVPSIIALLAGAFSDTTGFRKAFMIISMTGQMLSGINSIVNVYFMYELNLQVFVLSGAIIEGITGGYSLVFIIAFAFISSITTEENRTFRMGLVNFSGMVAYPIGTAVSGILLMAIDYYGCFALITAMHLICLLYVGLAVRDPKRTKEQKKVSIFYFTLDISRYQPPKVILDATCFALITAMHLICLLYVRLSVRDPKRTKEQKKHDQGCCHLLIKFFNFKNIVDSIKVITKKAPNNRRFRLCLIIGVACVLLGPTSGELAVMYLLTRFRFGWNEVDYSWFQTYNAVVQIVGTIISLFLLMKYLGWHDSMLSIISIVSKLAASFVYCFAPNARIFYIAPMVELLGGAAVLAVRSIISKLVEPFEIGKVSSVTGLIENLMPLIYVPLYTWVYTATMDVLPGAVFLVGAGLTLPALPVLMWWFYDYRKQLSRTKTQL